MKHIITSILGKEDGSPVRYYVLTDYLGSLTHIMDINGNIIEAKSNDAWGRFRNPDDWNPFDPTFSEMQFYRGYTGHEYIPEFGIINMNGRLYDPLIGRMFSPDPYIMGSDTTQGYNRYNYALNNPFTYTDPSGEFVWAPLIIGAAVFGIGNTIAHAIKGDINNFGEGLKYFGQGAIAGGVLGLGVSAGLTIPVLSPIIKIAGLAQAGFTVTSFVGGGISHGWKGVGNAGKILLSNFYLDENKTFFGGVWEGVSRHSYQFLQTNIAYNVAQFSNTIGKITDVDFWGGATFSHANYNGGSITLGNNILLSNFDEETMMTAGEGGYTTMHEYGHYLQSQRNGFSYLFKYGIPSGFKNRSWTELDANLRASKYFEKNNKNFTWNTNYYRNGSIYSRFPKNNQVRNTLWWEWIFFPLSFLWN